MRVRLTSRHAVGMPQRRPPVPTLGQLRRESSWLWINCAAGCGHHRAVAVVPFIIRYGANASSDVLRHSARCSKCGHKGATLQHPSWDGSLVGWMPFPMTASPSPRSREESDGRE